MSPPLPLSPAASPTTFRPDPTCEVCGGTDHVGVHFPYGAYSEPNEPGYRRIERCDACQAYGDDEDACRGYVAKHGLSAFFCKGGSDDSFYAVLDQSASPHPDDHVCRPFSDVHRDLAVAVVRLTYEGVLGDNPTLRRAVDTLARCVKEEIDG